MNLKFGLPPRCEMLSIAAGDEVVNGDDSVAASEQQISQVRAEKAGGAGDDGDNFWTPKRTRFFYGHIAVLIIGGN